MDSQGDKLVSTCQIGLTSVYCALRQPDEHIYHRYLLVNKLLNTMAQFQYTLA